MTRSEHQLTAVGAWLIRLGAEVWHGRPRHPQTQGKAERLNRTLQIDVITRRRFADLAAAQAALDAWRQSCHQERPHEALGRATPISRYVPSPRPFPEILPAIEHAPGGAVRQVDAAGAISWRERPWTISHALAGQPVGLRPTLVDGVAEVRFCHPLVRTLDQRAGPTCGHYGQRPRCPPCPRSKQDDGKKKDVGLSFPVILNRRRRTSCREATFVASGSRRTARGSH